jgi:hypothetical protein
MKAIKEICFLTVLLLTLNFQVQSQTGFKTNRNWLIGKYVGVTKDSSNHTPWVSYTLTINYCANISNFYCDSMCDDNFSPHEFFVYCDSTIHDLYGPCNFIGTSPTYGGKLNPDSTYTTWAQCVPAEGCNPMKLLYFIGKKVESYVGVHETEAPVNVLSIYPNPSQNRVWVTPPDKTQEYTYQLYNIAGSLIKQGSLAYDEEIDISSLENALYYIRLISSRGYSKGIFIKE